MGGEGAARAFAHRPQSGLRQPSCKPLLVCSQARGVERKHGLKRCRGELAAARLALARVRAGGRTGLVLAGPVAGAASSAKRLTLLGRGSGLGFLGRRLALTWPAPSRLAAARPALRSGPFEDMPMAGGPVRRWPVNAPARKRERETTGAGESKTIPAESQVRLPLPSLRPSRAGPTCLTGATWGRARARRTT